MQTKGSELFDRPKPLVWIGVQPQQKYSQGFSIFDRPEPLVWIGFQTKQ